MVLLEEMDGKFRHASLAHNNCYASLSELLDKTFELVLLAGGVVKEIVSIFEENGTLGLTLLHLNVSVEDSNFGIGNVLNRGFRSFGHNNTSDNLGVHGATTENLLDSDVVNVEFHYV